MKKGLFTAAVIAAMMMTQPVMAQEVVEQTGLRTYNVSHAVAKQLLMEDNRE